MYYTVLDVAELIDYFDINVEDIEECTGVWGDGFDLVVCLTLVDEYVWLEKKGDWYNIVRQENESFEKYLSYHFEDYILNPDDINNWLEDGGRLEDAHEF